MLDWIIYALAILLFFLTHSIPVRPTNKSRIVARVGGRGFTLGYSVLSIAALSFVIIAANRAPIVQLWPWSLWQNHVTLLAMAGATIIAALAVARPNPLSFGGSRNHLFDPKTPGIVGWMRHPLLVALLLWALGHLVPNGTLAHVILFGIFAGFSALGMRIIDRRQKRVLGAENWQHLSTTARHIRPSLNGLLRLVIGLGVYVLLILLHGPVIGAYPLP
ncbi:NnrU family protein [Aliiroseovarius sp. S253]|uniref:NnrU family protein n=1 Tax=Aliiroseovarius sp. S253 TaxID=3415133 RepID=UPI003C7C6270